MWPEQGCFAQHSGSSGAAGTGFYVHSLFIRGFPVTRVCSLNPSKLQSVKTEGRKARAGIILFNCSQLI